MSSQVAKSAGRFKHWMMVLTPVVCFYGGIFYHLYEETEKNSDDYWKSMEISNYKKGQPLLQGTVRERRLKYEKQEKERQEREEKEAYEKREKFWKSIHQNPELA